MALNKIIKFELEDLLSIPTNLIAGIDEVGRGALAGPVVAGAVIFKDRDYEWIDRINDSKLLKPDCRKELASLIKDHCYWGIGSVSNHVIDQIGIELSIHLAMTQALTMIFKLPDLILVDGNVKLVFDDILVKNIIKGDQKSVSIAAASIIAKVHRDQYLEKLSKDMPQYNLESNVGYGTKYHIESIKEFGPSTIHRNSFKPVKDLV
ncbi:MAG: ribonuclease HII [Dehalococcoidia bacterium]|nr:ribonuclease HII [Dehalococcoidia bacterium]